MYKNFIKRILDVIVSVVAVVITAVPMAVIAVLIKLESEGPVLFKQERLGLHGKVFTIYKFRTMCVGAEKTGTGVYSGKGHPRVTKLGRILRATSLDEIPQFFNILKGDMSCIGPRPPLTYHPWPVEQYTAQQFRMFDVRPGVTGWAQVNGRKAVEWNNRIQMNVWYVDNVSLMLDLKILAMTVLKVLTNENNENTGATVQH